MASPSIAPDLTVIEALDEQNSPPHGHLPQVGSRKQSCGNNGISAAGSTSDLEDYEEMGNLALLELVIKPDLPHNKAIATLAVWCVA